MALLDVTLPSGPLTVAENGTPNQGFGVIGIASGLLASLNLSTLTLVGEDAALFGITAPNALGQVQIFARQSFDFEDQTQRNFDVALQAQLLAPAPILGDVLGGLVTLTSAPISVTVTDVNDNAPSDVVFVPAGGILAGEVGAVLGDLSLVDVDTVNGLVGRVTGPDAALIVIDGNTIRLADTVSLTVGQTINAQVFLTDGVNPIEVVLDLGQSPPNVIPPGPGTGTPGGDTLPGSDGGDGQFGGGGDDTVVGGPGADTLDGGDGTDGVDYSGSPGGVRVDLTTGTGSGGSAEGDTLTSIENVIGSAFDDTLIGNDNTNELRGGDGNDTLDGRGGNDLLIGGNGFDTIVLRGAFESYAITDLGVEVRLIGPDGADTVIGAERLVFQNGVADYGDGDPLFDSLFYYSRNLDVFSFPANAKQHYETFGIGEGRDPNAFFDTDAYLAANADVRAAGLNPLEHYRTNGFKEGRDPGRNFDIENYLARNPDVARAGVDPLTHYLSFGRFEGREAIQAVGRVGADGFDAEYYLMQNQDVALAGVDPLTHYLSFGRVEGRNPNAYFSTQGYLLQNPDVARAGVDAFTHYLQFGWTEGRDPSTLFDTDLYLQTYGDVDAANVNPLLHFLQFGATEGRVPVTDFSFN